jgi:hypothetical protein
MTRRPSGPLGLLVSASVVAAACGVAPAPSADPLASPGADPTPLVVAASPAPGDAVSFSPRPLAVRPDSAEAGGFDTARISEDGRLLVLEVIAGAPWDPRNPQCTQLLTGWAGIEDGVLVAAVVDVTPPLASPDPELACAAMGHLQEVRIPLAVPYRGWLIRELGTHHPHLLRAPDRSQTLAGLAPRWVVVREEDATNPERWTVPVWRTTWTANGGPMTGTGEPGQVDLYLGFGDASGITGSSPGSDVEVGGRPGVLYRDAERGELVLVWMIDGDGLAIVANEADIPEADLFRLAEGVVRR